VVDLRVWFAAETRPDATAWRAALPAQGNRIFVNREGMLFSIRTNRPPIHCMAEEMIRANRLI
jgi:hypothetical protein